MTRYQHITVQGGQQGTAEDICCQASTGTSIGQTVLCTPAPTGQPGKQLAGSRQGPPGFPPNPYTEPWLPWTIHPMEMSLHAPKSWRALAGLHMTPPLWEGASSVRASCLQCAVGFRGVGRGRL